MSSKSDRTDAGTQEEFAWKLDRESPVPLYLQIRQQLVVMISEWPDPNQKFHSDEYLTEYFDVAKATVRQALSDLTQSGLLRRKRGAGTFVVPPLVERLHPSPDIEKHYQLSGGAVSFRVHALEERLATASEARTLGIPEGEPVLYLKRVRLIAHIPVAIDERVMPKGIAEKLGISTRTAAASIIDLVQDKLELSRATWELNARLAGQKDSALLQIAPTDPILVRSLVYYAPDDTTILMGDTRHRSDMLRCGFEMNLSEETPGADIHSWTSEALLDHEFRSSS